LKNNIAIPFIDLHAQQQRIKKQIDENIQKVLAHGQYIQGPEITTLEKELSKYLEVKHSMVCANGTVALQLALMALGVGPGDEVITVPFSFFATAEAILLVGATPVFIDIDSKTYNMNAALLEDAITLKTKAIIPVSLYGQCADFTAINAIAEKYGLPVIEDAAQSFGAQHHGKKSCGLSTIACTSFFPSKPLGGYGDGGACFTNDDAIAQKIRMILNHGQKERYVHEVIGTNARLSTLHAAILLPKLAIFPDELQARQQVAAWYKKYLPEQYPAPFVESFNLSAYGQFTIRVQGREKLQEYLKERGIPTAVHYPIPLNQQPVFKNEVFAQQHFPHSEKAAREVMSLPFHPYMTEEIVKKITQAL
jgi:UDP-2-acetamido-2-deoxy-ribo-hexuluronate aminotransferase